MPGAMERNPKSSRRPLIIACIVFIIVVVIVGVVVWKLTKDAYEVSDPSAAVVEGTSEPTTGTEKTTRRPYTKEELIESPWLSLRMSRDILPVHYDITMFPDFYGDAGEFYGNETIELNVRRPSKYILVHAHPVYMNVTSARVEDNSTGAEVTIRRTFLYDENEYYVIELADVIEHPVLLTLGFQGSLTASIVGIYKSTYFNTFTNQTRSIASSKFEPTFARRAFPCLDEPNIKAMYTITIVHAPDYIALSNMPADGAPRATPGHRGMMSTQFQRSVKMSTYLVCFIVCDFKYIETNSSTGIPIRIYTQPDKLGQANYSLEIAKHTLEYYELLFDVPYALPKIDLIAIPDFVSGAMEHWGLITFRESRLLYDPLQASLGSKQTVAYVVAHEMSHMWFGNLVTMDWWNDLWLNEGFASYMEYAGTITKEPQWDIENKFLIQDMYPVMNQDAALSSHPIVVDVQNPNQITSVFDSISYSKGASVIRMLEHIIGSEKFYQGVGAYLKMYKWGNARTNDLWKALDQVDMNHDVKAIMDTWTLQDGYPYINISMETSTTPGFTEVTAQQSRFLSNPSSILDHSASPFGYKWYVALDYKTSSDMTGSKVMNMTDIRFVANLGTGASGGWIKFNHEQKGFYRVLYSDDLWKSFADHLQQTDDGDWKLDVADRAGLLNDAFHLAAAGLTPYDIPLEMMAYLDKEEDYVPWSAVLVGGVNYIVVMLKQDPEYGLWRSFLAGKVAPVVNSLGFNDTGTHLNRQLRALLVGTACMVDEETTVTHVNQQFRDWLDNGVTPSVNLRRVIYAYGMANIGSESDWDKVWNRYLVEPSPQEKETLMVALASTRKPNLIAKLLDKAKRAEGIKTQDFFSVVSLLGSNTVASRLVWDWARDNYQSFIDRFTLNDRSFGRMIYYMVRNYNTKFQLKQVQAFFKQFPDAGAGERYRRMALESIQKNIQWMDSYRSQVLEWLSRNA